MMHDNVFWVMVEAAEGVIGAWALDEFSVSIGGIEPGVDGSELRMTESEAIGAIG